METEISTVLFDIFLFALVQCRDEFLGDTEGDGDYFR